jgi:hypothetical protein
MKVQDGSGIGWIRGHFKRSKREHFVLFEIFLLEETAGRKHNYSNYSLEFLQ